jgi:betaine-homocysteine S-methyltransferase
MILKRLDDDIVLGDGGTLFELERRGYVSAGPFTPEVSIEHPEALKQLHTDFARAGAQVIQAFTYYAHEEKLKQIGKENALAEINSTAVFIANQVADEYGCMVAGNLSNTWVYDPADPKSHTQTRRQFDKQIEYQLPHGIDFFIAETIEYIGEAIIALEAIQAAAKPAMITLGFKYGDKTLEGLLLEDAFKKLEAAGADIVGINCFRDPERMLPLAARARQTVSCHVATQPVAYRCSDDRPYFQIQEYQGQIAFPLQLEPFGLTRFEMASYAITAKEMGINYIGGCCGTAPHHLRAMAEILGRTVPNSKYRPQINLHPIIGNKELLKEKDERILCEQRYGKAACHFLSEENKK